MLTTSQNLYNTVGGGRQSAQVEGNQLSTNRRSIKHAQHLERCAD